MVRHVATHHLPYNLPTTASTLALAPATMQWLFCMRHSTACCAAHEAGSTHAPLRTLGMRA
eukprot:173582-Chlamydomonas_euryale.AAC.1